ncbi:bola-like protein [Ganoderma leucocontextum]|nr:bola-like protein [Ganoderma leucocontextum]
MLSLALARRIARPSLAAPANMVARWYAATAPASHAHFSTDGERLIRQKLTERFKPSELRVEDVSGGCGTFYNIIIASEQFKGLSLVKQQRLVNQTLKEEIQGIHGLQLKTVVPS